MDGYHIPDTKRAAIAQRKGEKNMAYVKQFNKIIKRSSTPIPYRIGFVNDKKMEDETELDAKDVKA